MIHSVRILFNPVDAHLSLLNRQWKKYSQVVVVTDRNTAQYCLPRFKNTFVNKTFIHLNLTELTEQTKTLSSVESLANTLMTHNIDRQAAVVALGGGVVTDTVGFTAAIYKRGLQLYYIPTTLLGMVDAALGGKNGVNFNDSKNQLGTFYQPHEVLIDPGYLSTLAHSEWKSGFAEMLKHGLIADYAYFESLIRHLSAGKMTVKLHEHIIRSVEIKMRIIQEDFRESGKRKILNFGHTIGHALEACALRRGINISHGHAVALGMAVETALSVAFAGLDKSFARSIIKRLLEIYPVPGALDEASMACMMQAMKHDKKNMAGKPSLVLLQSPGRPVFGQKIPESNIREFIRNILFTPTFRF